MIKPQVRFTAYIFKCEIHRFIFFLIIPRHIVVELLIRGEEKYLFKL